MTSKGQLLRLLLAICCLMCSHPHTTHMYVWRVLTELFDKSQSLEVGECFVTELSLCVVCSCTSSCYFLRDQYSHVEIDRTWHDGFYITKVQKNEQRRSEAVNLNVSRYVEARPVLATLRTGRRHRQWSHHPRSVLGSGTRLVERAVHGAIWAELSLTSYRKMLFRTKVHIM